MCSQQRHRTTVRQLLRIAAVEQVVEERMVLGYDNDQVDLVIFGELGNGFLEIVHADEIKFGIKFCEHLLHFCSLSQELFGKGNVVLVVYIYDMEIGLEKFQYGLDRQYGCTIGYIFKVGSKRNIVHARIAGIFGNYHYGTNVFWRPF